MPSDVPITLLVMFLDITLGWLACATFFSLPGLLEGFPLPSRSYPRKMPPNQSLTVLQADLASETEGLIVSPPPPIRAAILGCGMMGQEHISYISGFPNIQIDYLCDPHEPSLQQSIKILHDFHTGPTTTASLKMPLLLSTEEQLEHYADDIDLLVIATPNYQHTDTLVRWGGYDVTILVEKPVCVSLSQHQQLRQAAQQSTFRARVWVAMEYRFMPAIAKLLELLPAVGDVKMVTIRENRFPFLNKVGAWNRDLEKTGDSLVEKCVHFFDLFRLIAHQEADLPRIRALAQRRINYQDETPVAREPIIDAAYVVVPFQQGDNDKTTTKKATTPIMACLELCMYAEGSRHQEEVIVTGSLGRLEAYLPENKVYQYARPTHESWSNRREPPPVSSVKEVIHDCNRDLVATMNDVSLDPALTMATNPRMPTHPGYHYGSTAVEWKHLLEAMHHYEATGSWEPLVSLDDGLRAVAMGLQATASIVNEQK